MERLPLGTGPVTRNHFRCLRFPGLPAIVALAIAPGCSAWSGLESEPPGGPASGAAPVEAAPTAAAGELAPADPLPPLVVEGETPLLLDETTGDLAPATAAAAENEACYHCHANYQEEPLVLAHASHEIGCVKCHGPSHDHRDDENNITPPDRMYPLDTIDESCRACHGTHDAAAVAVIARWRERVPETTELGRIVCTDCHGEHRLRIRTVRWNRATGELLPESTEEKE